MNKKNLEKEADTFRYAIEKARDAGEFDSKSFNREPMSNFPKDCCDDTADLFTHYLFQKYNVDSIRIDGEYYDERYGHCVTTQHPEKRCKKHAEISSAHMTCICG